MTIDRKASQLALSLRGYSIGGADGVFGKRTYAGLAAFVAKRDIDDQLLAIGAEMALWLPVYEIDATPQRLAEFLAETCHESGGYKRFSENMNYSAKRLTEVWPSRFPTLASAAPFVGDAKKLANYVYGGRMGNEVNGTDDDDGWDHRGSGMLQHTGAEEYAKLKERIDYDCDDVRDPAKSVRAACDYWQRKTVNAYIDRGDYKGVRRAINGGTLGLAEIADLRNYALGVLK